MKQGVHCLKLQSARRSAFAKVVLTATPAEKWLEITFNAAEESRWWLPEIEFGIRYACDQLRSSSQKLEKGVHISIDEVQATVVDTSQMAMAYTASLAFFDAVEISPDELPTYDPKTHIVTFPA